MKFGLSAALIGLAATVASAQDLQTGPWNLKVKGSASTSNIDGYLSTCHSGAALSALCYGTALEGEASSFLFNYTVYNKVDGHNTGYITWNQPYTDENNQEQYVNQAMSLTYLDNSNVAAVSFGFDGSFFTGWDNNELFGAVYGDDSKNTPGTAPAEPSSSSAYYNWALCWQYVGGGYYYQSVAWIQLGKPHNPTCEAVTITRVAAKKS
ncbi:hypothetical protein F5Y16DRAFT_361508 [Xylariaceae sp. FL0255]|nr:hypothetical protein F5Y16DRAFT_361508 [Xylariaceae sp. FL0255]